MSIENRRQFENTQKKLRELEQQYSALQQRPTADDHVRELTMRSLQSLMKQLREEIARYPSRCLRPHVLCQ